MGNRYTSAPLAERLWAKVEKTDTCWLWTGAVDRSGYGAIGVGSRLQGIARVHRVSWEIANGRSVPEGLQIAHKCDVKLCVRPTHLEPATRLQNMAGAVERNRLSRGPQHPVPRGMAHWKAKLTDEQVADIRSRHATGETGSSLARAYGISQAHVSRLARRLSRI
jgi:hypothetical protein